MLTIALSTLKLRWVSFLGSFTALVLGAGLIAAMGQVLATSAGSPDRAPQRYAGSPVVVIPDNQLTVPTWQGTSSQPLAESRGLPSGLAAKVPQSVVDRVFPVRLGSKAATGRPWSAARAVPHTLINGRAPAAADEIVVSGHAKPGDKVDGYLVVGVTTPGPELTVFFTDAQAAALSPRIDALAVWGMEAEVRAVVGGEGIVLTGQDRALVDPTLDSDASARNNTNTIVGIALGFAAFVAIFVVSSTFAFAVAQRRREFALLRTIGATAGQVRRMLYAEAGFVALLASALGAALGPLGAPLILGWLTRLGMAPDWLVPVEVSWPRYVAFCAGLSVAMFGVVAASARAGRVRPAEALRESAVEPKAMPLSRWITGLAALAYALGTMVVLAVVAPESATNRKTYMPVLMLLVLGAGMLAPVVVRPVTLLLTVPLTWLRGAGGTVVAGSVLASTRRTAAVATPVLMAIGLAGSLIGASAMTDSAKTSLGTRSVLADYVVLPGAGSTLDAATVKQLQSIPGIDVAAPIVTSVYTLEGNTILIRRPAQAVDPATLVTTIEVAMLAGSLADLRDNTIVVADTWGLSVGDTAHVWLADGSEATLNVVGLLGPGAPADSYVTQALAFSAHPGNAYIKLKPGTEKSAVAAALADIKGAKALPRDEWAAKGAVRNNEASRLGLLVVLGIVLAFMAIALVNTLLMAASDRTADQATLRTAGATSGQVLRFIAGEALVVVSVGTVLAAATIGLSLLGVWAALAQVAGSVEISVPWPALAIVTGTCAVLAVLASVLPALWTRKHSPA